MAGMTGWWDSQSNIQRQCKYIGYINNKKKKPCTSSLPPTVCHSHHNNEGQHKHGQYI
jgi:hypothetical protein